MLCVRVCIVRVSDGLVWLVSHVFHYWWKKDAVCLALSLVFLITADREMVPILFGASPYHQLGWAEPYCKNAFVRLRLQMLYFSIPFSDKTIDPIAVSANPTIDHSPPHRSRRHEQSLPPIMKNVRYKPNNPTETRTIQARTQIVAQHSELGISDLHLNTAT